jgi:hypothetical protein
MSSLQGVHGRTGMEVIDYKSYLSRVDHDRETIAENKREISENISL